MTDDEFNAKAAAIKWLILDVDGVLTDGKITYAGDGPEIKAFHVRDGLGLRLWREAGRGAAVITGRESAAVARRCAELGLAPVSQGARDKAPAFRALLAEIGAAPAQCCVLGDDLPDLPPMLAAGLGIAVADAADEVLEAADRIAPLPGGAGAVRWAVERLLAAQGHWNGVIDRYRRPA